MASVLKRAKPDEALKTLGELGANADAEVLGLRAIAVFASRKAEAGLQSLQAAAQRLPEDVCEPRERAGARHRQARQGRRRHFHAGA